jgi:hypothetical protein
MPQRAQQPRLRLEREVDGLQRDAASAATAAIVVAT